MIDFTSLSDKQYGTILADPPYQYRNKNTGGSMKSGSAAQYPTLTLDEIRNLPVPDIAAKDSVCFLWVTVPLLPDGLMVLNTWGYQYKTAIFWRKIMSLGMGFWYRGQVEVCLLGIKGKVKAFRSQKCNTIQSKAGKHSEKPDAIFNLIDPVAPTPKIELFARRRRSGWDSWGLELEGKE